MNRKQLINATAAAAGLTSKEVQRVVAALEGVFLDEVRDGGQVVWSGLLKAQAKHNPERQSRNPQTGQPLTIPARTVARVTPLKALKDAAAVAQHTAAASVG